MTIRVGIIGIGGFGSQYLDKLLPLEQEGLIELCGAVVRNPQRSANSLARLDRERCAIFPTPAELYRKLHGALDLICIPTGIEFHEQMVAEALHTGVDVLVEKPLTGTPASAARMLEAARNAPEQFVAVGFQHIYAREVQQVKRLLLQGALGTIRQIRMRGIWPRDNGYYLRNSWAGKLVSDAGTVISDSPLNNAFAHYLNIGLFWCGADFESAGRVVAVTGDLWRTRPIESFDCCNVRFQTVNDVGIECRFTHCFDRNEDPLIELEADGGTVEWRHNGPWRVSDRAGMTLAAGVAEPPNSTMFRDVIARCEDRKRFVCSMELASEHVHAIDLLHRSCPIIDLSPQAYRCEPGTGQRIITDLNALWQMKETEIFA